MPVYIPLCRFIFYLIHCCLWSRTFGLRTNPHEPNKPVLPRGKVDVVLTVIIFKAASCLPIFALRFPDSELFAFRFVGPAFTPLFRLLPEIKLCQPADAPHSIATSTLNHIYNVSTGSKQQPARRNSHCDTRTPNYAHADTRDPHARQQADRCPKANPANPPTRQVGKNNHRDM